VGTVSSFSSFSAVYGALIVNQKKTLARIICAKVQLLGRFGQAENLKTINQKETIKCLQESQPARYAPPTSAHCNPAKTK
jgi:hypothetical protein